MQGVFWNIIGVLKGDLFGTENDKIIGLTAHYDTVNTSAGRIMQNKLINK